MIARCQNTQCFLFWGTVGPTQYYTGGFNVVADQCRCTIHPWVHHVVCMGSDYRPESTGQSQVS